MSARRETPVLLLVAVAWASVGCNGLLGSQDAQEDNGGGATMPDATLDAPAGDAALEADASGDATPEASLVDVGDGPTDAGLDTAFLADAPYTVLAFDTNGPTAVTIDSANVYWIDGTRVEGCAKTGCSGAPNPYYTMGVALMSVAWTPVGNRLYWTDLGKGSVSFCSLPGCTAPQTITATLGPQRLAFDTTNVFWTSQEQGGAVDSCAIGSACGTPTTFPASAAFAIAVGGSNLYYTAGALAYCALSTCPLGGYFNEVSPNDVAADPSGLPVCVTVPSGAPSTGEVDCVFNLGTTAVPQKVVSALPDPRYVGLDGTYVYWADDTSNALYRCPLGAPCGASPALLASFPQQPGTFVVDKSTIYGTVTGPSGFVYVLPKPP